MSCPYCGNALNPGVTQCPRCGGQVLPAQPEPPQVTASPAPPGTAGGYGGDLGNASSPFSAGLSGPMQTSQPLAPEQAAAPHGSGAVFTSAPPEAEVSAQAAASPPAAADPEAELRTHIVSASDRQEVLETKIVESVPTPTTEAPALDGDEKKGLPDSRVARGVEDTFLGVRRFLLRLGRVGRIAFFAHTAVILGAVCPWHFTPHMGYTPGVEGWGLLPLGLSAASIAMLAWRFRPTPKARVLPVLLHLALAAGLVLSMAWIYQQKVNMPDHLEPQFAFGVYIAAVGTVVALVAALVGLKDTR